MKTAWNGLNAASEYNAKVYGRPDIVVRDMVQVYRSWRADEAAKDQQIYNTYGTGLLGRRLVTTRRTAGETRIALDVISTAVPLTKAAQAGKLARLAVAAESAVPSVTANRVAGNAFRDELAAALRAEGRDVRTEVYKPTPFGKRYMDIEVRMNGEVLGGIETKVGSSRYTWTQQLKDWWLKNAEGYPVNVARDK